MAPVLQPSVAGTATDVRVPAPRRPDHDRTSGAAGRPTASRSPRRRRVRWGRVLAFIVLLLGVLLVVAVRAAGQANTVSRAGSETFRQVETVRVALLDGDIEQARTALAGAQRSAKEGTVATSGPLWRTLGGLPRVGNNFRTSAGLMAEGRHLTEASLPVILESAALLQSQVRPLATGVELPNPDVQSLDVQSPDVPNLDAQSLDRALAGMRAGMDDLTGTRHRIEQLPTAGLTAPVAASRSALLAGIDAAVSTLTSSEADHLARTVPTT